MIPTCISAAVLGLAVEFVNGRITKRALGRKGNPLAILPVRAALAVGFLVLVYFVSKHFGLDPAAPLICAALGASVGLALFTARLIGAPKDPTEKEEVNDRG